MVAEERERLFIEPRRMAELDGVPVMRGKLFEEACQPLEVFVLLLKIGRELPQNGAGSLCERNKTIKIFLQTRAGVLEPFEVGEKAAPFHREHESLPASDRASRAP